MKKKITVYTEQEVRKMVDEAGQLQQTSSIAAKLYKGKREQLYKPLKDIFGTEVVVLGITEKHQAKLVFDKFDDVDVVALIEEVAGVTLKGKSANKILRAVLSIRIEEARKQLNEDQKEKLIVEKEKKKPTLYVSAVKPSEEPKEPRKGDN